MTTSPHYHDTTDAVQIDEYEEKAAIQDDRVLAFMKRNADICFTAPQVWKQVDPDAISPITSYRRSLTNLTKAGHLRHKKEKHEQRPGIYGRPNTVWYFPMIVTQQQLF